MVVRIDEALLADALMVVPGEYDDRHMRAKRVVCRACFRAYGLMAWVEREPGVPELRCPCGRAYRLVADQSSS